MCDNVHSANKIGVFDIFKTTYVFSMVIKWLVEVRSKISCRKVLFRFHKKYNNIQNIKISVISIVQTNYMLIMT